MDDVTNLVAFKAISKFVKDLSEEFTGTDHLGLQLYNRLVEKTTIAHEGPVAKHVETFTKYCKDNRDAILSTDVSRFTSETESVTYSEKVTFNITKILKELADPECREIILDHLLIILGIVDKTASFQCKSVLMQRQQPATAESSNPMQSLISNDSKEGRFINDIISDVTAAVDPSKLDNPVEAVQTMLTSPAFANMLSKMQKGMQSGEINLGSLIGTLGGAMGAMNEGGENPLSSILGMASMFGGMAGPATHSSP